MPTPSSCLITLQRGVLEVDPLQLGLTPPSRSKLERWGDLVELRERTEPCSNGVGENSQTGLAQGATAKDFGRDGVRPSTATTTAFLRFRILPAGPWKFSRVFPLKLPRPVDWARDPSSAGEPVLEEYALMSFLPEENFARLYFAYHTLGVSFFVLKRLSHRTYFNYIRNKLSPGRSSCFSRVEHSRSYHRQRAGCDSIFIGAITSRRHSRFSPRLRTAGGAVDTRSVFVRQRQKLLITVGAAFLFGSARSRHRSADTDHHPKFAA